MNLPRSKKETEKQVIQLGFTERPRVSRFIRSIEGYLARVK